MKKKNIFLLLWILVWLIFSYNQTNASRSLSLDWCTHTFDLFNNTALVCTCTRSPMYAWWPVSFADETTINSICWSNVILYPINPLTSIANNTSTSSISEAGNIVNWPIWYIIMFILAISIIWVVIYAIRKWF